MGKETLESWTFEAVQERLVEAWLAWRRAPGRVGPGRGSPFAADAPYENMIRSAAAGDYDARGGELSSSEVRYRPVAATRAEVAERDEASAWLEMLAEGDRKLVCLAVEQLGKGAARVSWRALLVPMGLERGSDGLRMRYGRAIARIAGALNGATAGKDCAITPQKS